MSSCMEVSIRLGVFPATQYLYDNHTVGQGMNLDGLSLPRIEWVPVELIGDNCHAPDYGSSVVCS